MYRIDINKTLFLYDINLTYSIIFDRYNNSVNCNYMNKVNSLGLQDHFQNQSLHSRMVNIGLLVQNLLHFEIVRMLWERASLENRYFIYIIGSCSVIKYWCRVYFSIIHFTCPGNLHIILYFSWQNFDFEHVDNKCYFKTLTSQRWRCRLSENLCGYK